MLRHFFCPQCKSVFPSSVLVQRCTGCGSVLVARYDYQAISEKLAPDDLKQRAHNIWRYRELLPVLDEANIVSLAEGMSPVVALQSLAREINVSRLFIKDDSVMPLSSYRSRMASVSVSKAREERVPAIIARVPQVEALTLAAYAARAGLGAVLMIRREMLDEDCKHAILGSGASLFTYDYSEPEADAVVERTARAHGWFDASALHGPYRLEGAKSIGLEIAEAFDWQPPDVIVVPATGGTVLAGIYRAMRDLAALGWMEGRLPRLVAVQPENECPLVDAWKDKKLSRPIDELEGNIGFGEDVEFRRQVEYLALDSIYKSLGAAVAVSVDEVDAARRLFARREGIISSATGASTLAGTLRLAREGWIKRGERVLVYNPEGNFVPGGTILDAGCSQEAPSGADDVLPAEAGLRRSRI